MNDTAKDTSVTIGALQSPAVAKKLNRNGGSTQVTDCVTGFTKPAVVAKKPIVVAAKGARKKGMNMIGFNTIGRPNITGSLMLKIPGPTPSFATVL